MKCHRCGKKIVQFGYIEENHPMKPIICLDCKAVDFMKENE